MDEIYKCKIKSDNNGRITASDCELINECGLERVTSWVTYWVRSLEMDGVDVQQRDQ